jgi:hypothetical protein
MRVLSAPLYLHLSDYSWFKEMNFFFGEYNEEILGSIVLFLFVFVRVTSSLLWVFIKKKYFTKNSSKNINNTPLPKRNATFSFKVRKFIFVFKKIKYFFKRK